MNLVILKKDKYNFILAQPLEEPVESIVKFSGVETKLVTTHKNKNVFYGTLAGSIYGLQKHSKKIKYTIEELNKLYGHIKPDSNEESYSGFLDVGIDQILLEIDKEYNV